jgi:hypothetical protein
MSAHRLCINEECMSFLLMLTRVFARSGLFAAFSIDCPGMPWRKESGMR